MIQAVRICGLLFYFLWNVIKWDILLGKGEKGMEQKLETLCRLNGIECRIGGSTLLHHHGLSDHADDLDVFVEPDQFETIDAVLSRVGKKQESPPHPEYMTTYFGEYTFEGRDIDVMASFRIKCMDGIYTHPYIEPDGKWMHLEEWAVLYTVMGRTNRVKKIRRYFDTHIFNEEIIRTCLKRAPASIIEAVTEQFKGCMKR